MSERLRLIAHVDERHVLLAGVRDLEEHQRAPLGASALAVVPGRAAAGPAYAAAVDVLRERVGRVYLHGRAAAQLIGTIGRKARRQ